MKKLAWGLGALLVTVFLIGQESFREVPVQSAVARASRGAGLDVDRYPEFDHGWFWDDGVWISVRHEPGVPPKNKGGRLDTP